MNRVLLICFVLLGSSVAIGQSYEKEAKKQAKALEKEGWEVITGEKPLVAQLARSLAARRDFNLIVSEGSVSLEDRDMANKISKQLAQRNLAGMFASSVATLTKSTKGSDLESFLSESVVKVSASLRSNTLMTIYREAGGKFEFRTTVSCSLRDFWNLLPDDDKEKLKTEFNVSDETLELTGG